MNSYDRQTTKENFIDTSAFTPREEEGACLTSSNKYVIFVTKLNCVSLGVEFKNKKNYQSTSLNQTKYNGNEYCQAIPTNHRNTSSLNKHQEKYNKDIGSTEK